MIIEGDGPDNADDGRVP